MQELPPLLLLEYRVPRQREIELLARSRQRHDIEGVV